MKHLDLKKMACIFIHVPGTRTLTSESHNFSLSGKTQNGQLSSFGQLESESWKARQQRHFVQTVCMRSPRVSSTVQDRSIQNLQVGTSQGIRNGIADRSRSSKTNKQGQEGIDWPTLLTNWPWYTSKTHRITWSLEMKWLMLQLDFYGNVTISVRGYSDTASVSLSIVTSPYCLTAPNAGRASLEFALTPSRQPNTSWQLEPILPRRSYWIELASQHTPSLQACVMGDWL